MKLYGIMKDKIFSKLWFRILCFCTVPLFIFICIFYLEYMNYRSVGAVLGFWLRNPGGLILEFAVLAVISVILLLLTRKLWIYATVFGSLSVIMGIINCVKHAVNGDYFMPWDISMAGNMGQLIGFARFDLPLYIWILLPAIAIACVIYAFSAAEIPLKWYFRVPSAIACSIVFIVLYNMPKTTERILNKFNMSFNDSILQTSNYDANGFVNAFTINCFATKVVEPDGYDRQSIEAALSGYSAVNAGENAEKPDVIVILSEAFFDVTTLENTKFSQDPLSEFREISSRPNAYSGKLITSALGGGTVRTEFEILTGLTVDYLTNGTSPYLYVDKDIETYVSNYKNQGYFTKGIHTYNGDFYMRNTAYPYLGFDEFVSEDTIKLREDATWRRSYLTDNTLMNEIIDTLEDHTDTPNFIFAITMENHQSYGKTDPSDIVVNVENDSLDSDLLDSVTTYTQGAYYADKALKKLVDYIDSRERDTVLLFFGDHLPTLGSNQAAYIQAGNIDPTDGYDAEEKKFLYSTPYLFYSNYGIDYSILDSTDSISTYYMLSLLADMTDTKRTPYMQYLIDGYKQLPYYNVRLGLTLSEQNSSFINSIKLITFDRLKGSGYSVTQSN